VNCVISASRRSRAVSCPGMCTTTVVLQKELFVLRFTNCSRFALPFHSTSSSHLPNGNIDPIKNKYTNLSICIEDVDVYRVLESVQCEPLLT